MRSNRSISCSSLRPAAEASASVVVRSDAVSFQRANKDQL